MNYFLQANGVEAWRTLLRKPETQWKEGYSAYELTHAWQGGMPQMVQQLLQQAFGEVECLYGFPEYKVALPGGGAQSQSDLYVLTKTARGLLPIIVEGKAEESFGSKVEKWLGNDASDGKKKRLQFLCDQLGLSVTNVGNIYYQLLHRTVSAILEAKRIGASDAVVLVHSFSKNQQGFPAYAQFLQLLGIQAEINELTQPVQLQGVRVVFGWIATTHII